MSIPGVFRAGAYASIEWDPKRGQRRQSAVGVISERDPPFLRLDELDRRGDRHNEYRVIQLHADAERVESVTEQRATTLGDVDRVTLWGHASAPDLPTARMSLFHARFRENLHQSGVFEWYDEPDEWVDLDESDRQSAVDADP